MEATSSYDELLIELNKKYRIQEACYDEKDLQKLQESVNEDLINQTGFQSNWYNEATLVRFLKAFITVSDTVAALLKYSEWRAKYNVDLVSSEEAIIKKEDALRRSVHFDDITDRCNRIIVIVYPANHITYNCDYDSLYKYIIYKLEDICKLCDDKGTLQFCLVMDLKNFGMQNMDYTAVKKILWFLKNCYPERLGVCLIINYPWLFYACWEIIKLWLNERTQSKIIFGGRDEMNDFIDLNNFPLQFFES